MTSYVALLRGVNVGPATQVSMPGLKRAFEDLGFGEVATYIRSGNVVFAGRGRADALRRRVERGLAERLGIEVDVVLRTGAELADVVRRNPFDGAEPARLAVAFLCEPPPRELTAGLAGEDFGDDEYSVSGREIYLHLPNGFGRSRLGTRMSGLRAPVVGTVRNWRTVSTLARMAAAVGRMP